MGNVICSGAGLKCSMGTAPSVLNVLPVSGVTTGTPLASIMDNKPFVNVAPFGMCQAPSNPAVASATAAAAGVLTPQPCVPVTPAPWVPGSVTNLVGGVPVLDDKSKLMCVWGGVIEVTSPGQSGTTAS